MNIKMNNISPVLKGIGKILCLFLLLGLLTPAGLQASEYLLLNMRLYEGTVGDQAPEPSVVTTAFVEPYEAGNILSPEALKKEKEKLKKVYNISNVQMMIRTNWYWVKGYPSRLFRVFKENGNTFGILLTRGKKDDTFRIEVYDGDSFKKKENNLLETDVVLSQKNTVIFGFKDKKGAPYFLAFHREVDAGKVQVKKTEDPGGIFLSTQYHARLVRYARPVYPPEALKKGIEGRVFVRAQLDSSGKVVGARVKSGPRVLHRAALDAVEKWRYNLPAEAGRKEYIDFTAVVSFNQTSGNPKSEPVSLIGTAFKMEGGAAMEGVEVKVTNEDLGIKKSTKTDKNGFYGFMALPPAHYTLRFSLGGYMTLLLKKSLPGAGKTYKINVKLKKKK